MSTWSDGPAVSLNGSPSVSPNDCCLVGLAALAAVGTAFNEFLRIVPCTAAVVEDECKEDAGDGCYHEEAGEGLVFHGDTDDDREPDHEDTGEDHVPERTLGRDIDDSRVVRLSWCLP